MDALLGQLVRLRLRAPLSCSLGSGASVRGEGLRSTGRPAGSGSFDGRHHAQHAGPRRRLARPFAGRATDSARFPVGEGAVDLGVPHRDPLDPHSPPLGPPGAILANHSLPRTLGTFGLPQVRPPYLGRRAEAPAAPQAAAAPGSSRAMLAEPSAQNAQRAAAHQVKARGGAWSWRSAALSRSSSLPRAPVCLASGIARGIIKGRSGVAALASLQKNSTSVRTRLLDVEFAPILKRVAFHKFNAKLKSTVVTLCFACSMRVLRLKSYSSHSMFCLSLKFTVVTVVLSLQ